MTKSIPYTELAAEITHRALAEHVPNETCPDCRLVVCHHCLKIGRIGDDHTCSCHHPDDGCPNHPKPQIGKENY